MSTQNVITSKNLKTNEALAQFLLKTSTDLLKSKRFEFGCVDLDKVKEVLRLSKFVCNNLCYIEEEDQVLVREELIRKSILKLNEL